MSEGFLTTLANAEEFFKRCLEKEAVTYAERLKILQDMAKDRKVFKQTKEQMQKRINGKKVLIVRKDNKPNANMPNS